jgi:CHAT domain-containing protein
MCRLRDLGANRGLAVTILPDPSRADHAGRSLRDLIREATQGDQKHFELVHYAGHTYFPEQPYGAPPRGYFILPRGGDSREAEGVPFESISELFDPWAKLVFLNSCHSGAWLAASELARRGVPVVIGYRWKLNDTTAAAFAGKFYDALFGDQQRTIAQAFQTARRDIYVHHKDRDPTWASARLIMQNPQWHAA